MVCYVYSGIQGDVGLPGPSGTPGDGSLRSEKTLTIYKGDKVTQQGKDRNKRCSTLTSPTHTHSHTGSNRVIRVRMWRGLSTNNGAQCNKKEEQWLQQTLQLWRKHRREEKRLVPKSHGQNPIRCSECSDSLPHSYSRPASSPSLLSSGCAQQRTVGLDVRTPHPHPPPPASSWLFLFTSLFSPSSPWPLWTAVSPLVTPSRAKWACQVTPASRWSMARWSFWVFPKDTKERRFVVAVSKPTGTPSVASQPPPRPLAQPHHAFLKRFQTLFPPSLKSSTATQQVFF